VERWFRELTEKRIRRGNFYRVEELIAAIEEYIQQNNRQLKPSCWCGCLFCFACFYFCSDSCGQC
jgi:hypothetical protein